MWHTVSLLMAFSDITLSQRAENLSHLENSEHLQAVHSKCRYSCTTVNKQMHLSGKCFLKWPMCWLYPFCRNSFCCCWIYVSFPYLLEPRLGKMQEMALFKFMSVHLDWTGFMPHDCWIGTGIAGRAIYYIIKRNSAE